MKKLTILFLGLAGYLVATADRTPVDPNETTRSWTDHFRTVEKEPEPAYAAGHSCRITYQEYASLKPGKDTLYWIRKRAGCEGQFVSKRGLIETWRWYGEGKGYMTLTFEDSILVLRQMDNLL